MIELTQVIAFFDRLAPGWDGGMVRDEAVIAAILDAANVAPGAHVLDVACGTGVLIPDYLGRGAASVTAIDVSPQMIRIAREKFAGEDRVRFLCGDAQGWDFGRRFDCILIYNAFPHFSDPAALLGHLCAFLQPGGTLTVAHGMSREKINAHHSGSARPVSHPLPPAEEVAALFAPHLQVTCVRSDERMYLVTGTRPGASGSGDR